MRVRVRARIRVSAWARVRVRVKVRVKVRGLVLGSVSVVSLESSDPVVRREQEVSRVSVGVEAAVHEQLGAVHSHQSVHQPGGIGGEGCVHVTQPTAGKAAEHRVVQCYK